MIGNLGFSTNLLQPNCRTDALERIKVCRAMLERKIEAERFIVGFHAAQHELIDGKIGQMPGLHDSVAWSG